MEFNQVLELVKAVSDSKVTSFVYEEGEIKIAIKTDRGPRKVPPYVPHHLESEMPPHAPHHPEDEIPSHMPAHLPQLEGNMVVCPLVGTFYEAPSEDAEAFVKVGDVVKKGQTLAIVEAMKLMNEIECEHDGVVAEILVANKDTVEYGQPLFVIQ